MKTKLFTFLFAILAGIGTMSAEIYSGTCGDNISWLLNTTDSTLAITGSGEMDTYNNPAPWRLYSSYIKIVSLSDGITNIGYEAFASCSNLTTVNFPNSITVIGSYAFSRCSSLTSIDIPNTVTIIGGYAFMYCTNLATVSIPNSVTTIQNYAFYECWGLKSVIIPDKVTCIDQSTFFGCKNLSTAVIGNSVTEIKSAAFKNCQELTSIIIPNSVRRIEGNAFVNCSKMTSINIGDKVEYIGDGAFANCDSLKSIVVSNSNRTYDSRNNCNAIIEKSTNILVKGCMNTSIPNTVDSIGYQAFMNCKGLYSINIPDNVKCIGNSAFGGCTELKSVSFGSQLTDIRHRAFANCPQLTSITLPNGIKNIDSYVFSGCSGLSSITIPNSVLSIGGGAFEKCTSLTSFTIPNKISSIEYGVFSGCTRLTSIEIPTNITSIGERAFNGCSGLTSLTIPTSVTSIGDAAFWSCTGLTSVEIPNTVKTLGCFPYCSNLTSVIIPEGVTRLTSNAFYGCSRLTSVTIPKSVNSISEYAFEGCAGNGSLSVYISDLTAWFSIDFSGSMVTGETKLYLNGEEVKYVVTPYNITKINNYTFNKNKTFVSVHIHNDVDTIGARAFGDNTLKSVEIGSGMKYIGEGAFYRCPLTEIKCAALTPPILGYNTFYNVNKSIPLYVPEESIELYKEASGWKEFTNIQALIEGWQMCGDSLMWKINKFDLTIKGKGEMWNYEQFKAPWGKYIETVTIEEGVTSIGDNAFYCPDLTSISIPNSVSKIGGASFEFCRNLHFIQFGKGLIEIGWNAFYGCSSIDSVVLPDNLQIIKSAAFYDCPLTSITIPRNVTEIDDAAFYSDTFTAFDVVEENTTFTSIDGVLYNKEETKLLQYPKGKQGAFTIPYGIKSIEERAFIDRNGLDSIVIPNSVSEIGSSAFLGCSELSSVKISDSLINIGWNLFSGCKKLPIIDNIRMADTYIVEVTDMTLSSYTIPAATKWIHYDVFIECNNLDTLTCLAIIPPKAEFPDRIYNSVPLYVPAESVEAYRTKDGWKEFANILPILPPCEQVTTRDTLQITYGDSVIIGEGLPWQHSVVPTENGIYNDTLRTIYGCDSIVSHYIEVQEPLEQPSKCGENLTWSMNTTDGTLTITGSGDMTVGHLTTMDGTILGDGPHWAKYLENIVHVSLPEGLTSIADYSFGCIYGYGVEICPKLTSIEIPKNVTRIGKDAFYGCSTLSVITSNAINPPTLGEDVFEGIDTMNCILYVPSESVYLYKKAEQWKAFKNILPILPPCDKVASRDTIYAEICEGDVYDFHGMRLSEKGIYRDTLVDPHGCDSIVELFLTVHQIYGGGFSSDIIDTIQITYGEAVVFGEGLSWQHSIVPTENGIYSDTLRTIHGCDSIVSHYIEVSGKPDQPEEPSVLPTHAIDLDLTQSTSIMEWTIIDATLNGTASDISNGKYAYDIKANIPGIAYVTKEPNVQFITQNSNDKQKVIYIQSGQYLMFGGKRGVIKIMNTIAGDKILLTVASKGSTSASFLDDYGEYPKNAAAVSADLTLPAKDNTSVEADANGYIWKELEFVSMGGDVEIKEFAAGFCVKKVVVDSKYKYRQIGDLYYCLVDEYNYAVVIENPKAKYSGDIVIPDSISVEGKQYNVQIIEYFAFADCTELASITSKSTTPPSYQHNTFQGVDSMLPIYVPQESVETYRNAWSRFKNINPLEAEEEVTIVEPTAEPMNNSVVIEWPKDESAETYTIVIKKGDETICTLTFNAQGQLVTISYAAPSRNGKARHAQEAVLTTTGWQYTINGLDANTEYTYIVIAKKSDNSVVYEKSVPFKTKDSATGIENVQSDNVQGTKVLRDGQMYILRGEKIYDARGMEVR